MISEEIKNEIVLRAKEAISRELSIFNLPLISQYKVLCFTGIANNNDLTLAFPIAEITDRIMIIKSFRVIPYYNGVGIDITMTDGASTFNEAMINQTRIDRLFDEFASATRFTININGTTLPLFPVDTVPGYPLDLWLDNILYKFPEKIKSMSVRVDSSVVNDLTTGALVDPKVKVVIECYLI